MQIRVDRYIKNGTEEIVLILLMSRGRNLIFIENLGEIKTTCESVTCSKWAE
jgi:hypothetical protein